MKSAPVKPDQQVLFRLGGLIPVSEVTSPSALRVFYANTMRRFHALPLAIFIGTLAGAAWAASPEPVSGDWPRWRGPFDNGMARGDAPVEFSSGENVVWRAEIPGLGHSSPVLWEDRVFVTTAVPLEDATATPRVPHRLMVMALDRETGKPVWEREAATVTPHESYHEQYGSYASHSPVTDGDVLIAFFGSRGVYAYSLDGDLKWSKDFGDFQIRREFGEGTAPVLHENVVLLNFDHEGEDFIVALDKSNGRQLWRTAREEPSSWSAPLVLEHGGRTEVVVAATNKVRSYDIETGDVIWEAAGLGLNAIPAPVTDGERVIVMTGFRDPNLLAIKLGGEGDLTGNPDYIQWTTQRGTSYTPSPVLHDGVFYMLTDRGMLSALNAETGDPYYLQQRLSHPSSFKASPVGANGKLYLSSENGEVTVVAMGTEYKELAVNVFEDEVFIATPAIADGEIYLRGRNSLYKIR